MLSRTDVERIVENSIRENLTINVSDGDFTSPNSRKIEVRYGTEVIATEYFDVKEQREYEG